MHRRISRRAKGAPTGRTRGELACLDVSRTRDGWGISRRANPHLLCLTWYISMRCVVIFFAASLVDADFSIDIIN